MIIVACGNEKPSAPVALNDVRFECHEASATDCVQASAGKKVFIGISNSIHRDCGSLIREQEEFGESFVAWGETNAIWDDENDWLYGYVYQWFNNNGKPITELDGGEYLVCGYIDGRIKNRNLDEREPLAEARINLGSLGSKEITEWSDFSPHTPTIASGN